MTESKCLALICLKHNSLPRFARRYYTPTCDYSGGLHISFVKKIINFKSNHKTIDT